MRLHCLQIPHTLPTRAYSHCAFTQKARLFPGMLRGEGFHTIAYGNGDGAEVEATEWVTVLDEAEHARLLGPRPATELVGARAQVGSPVYQQFNYNLRDALSARLEPGDAICLPFGAAHDAAIRGLPLLKTGEVAAIETGIGYPDPVSHYRVYESEAWRHWVLGNEGRESSSWPRLEWVVPNYYDPADWPLARPTNRDRIVYLGRLQTVKGLDLIGALAPLMPDLTFEICGQGDPASFCTAPNIHYRAPITGRARAKFLGSALAAIFPSRFVEPFCGAAVEAMLCGTPVVTSDVGAFTETVLPGVNGFRCRTLDGWLRALREVAGLDRTAVRESARSRYTIPVVGARYRAVFQELATANWHSLALGEQEVA
jgi:glycosyltransferase involved in cell wall biosynthesis